MDEFSNSNMQEKAKYTQLRKSSQPSKLIIPSSILELVERQRGLRHQTSSSNRRQCRRYAEAEWQSVKRNNRKH